MSRICYWPDGSTASGNQTICSAGSESACCPSGMACTKNGLCYDLGYLKRGSCTDKTWSSSACPKYCYLNDGSSNSGVQNATNDILSCGNYILLNHFTCAIHNPWGSYGSNCSNNNVLDFSDQSQLAIVYAAAISDGGVNSTLDSGTNRTSASSGSLQSATTASSSGLSGGTIGAAVAAGIVGLLFMITLGMLISERRKNNRQMAQIAELGGCEISHLNQFGDQKVMPRTELPGRHSPVHELSGQA